MGMKITSERKCPICSHLTCVTEFTPYDHKYKTSCASFSCGYEYPKVYDDYCLLDEKCVNCKKGCRVISHEIKNYWIIYCVLPTCRNKMYVTEGWIRAQINYHRKEKAKYYGTYQVNKKLEYHKLQKRKYQDWESHLRILKDGLDK